MRQIPLLCEYVVVRQIPLSCEYVAVRQIPLLCEYVFVRQIPLSCEYVAVRQIPPNLVRNYAVARQQMCGDTKPDIRWTVWLYLRALSTSYRRAKTLVITARTRRSIACLTSTWLGLASAAPRTFTAVSDSIHRS